jgi:hypothetical protein
MSEYLAPGVYVEEVSFRSKSIEGVSTSTAGFVGATRFGPINGDPELLTSFNQFERIFGGLDQLVYRPEDNFAAPSAPMHNYLAHAVRAFFDNGGRRLYVARAFRSFTDVNQAAEPDLAIPADLDADGYGSASIPAPAAAIVTAENAATAGVQAATRALATTNTVATGVLDASITALNAAVGHFEAALPAGMTLPGPIDLATITADALLAAMDTLIGTLADAEQAAAQAARDAVAELISNAAETRDVATLGTALRAAVARFEAALPAGTTLPGPIDLATITADALLAAMDTLIGTLADAEQAAAQAARDAVAELISNAATRDTAPAQAAINAAIANGRAAGDAVLDADLPVVDTANTTAATSATATATQTAAVDAAAENANTASQALVEAIAALAIAGAADRVARATAVVTAAVAVNTTATAVVTAVTNLLTPVTNAARDARIAVRAATAAAVGSMRARFPGAAGNLQVTMTTRLDQNVLSAGTGGPQVSQVQDHDLVWLSPQNAFFIAERANGSWRFAGEAVTIPLADLNPGSGDTVRIATFTVEVLAPGAFAQPQLWNNLTVHPDRLQDGILNVFAPVIPNRARMLETPLVLESPVTAIALARGLVGNVGLAALPTAPAAGVTTRYQLSGGTDGVRPTSAEYQGIGDENSLIKSGLRSFEDLEEISIVAAPGVSFGANNGYANEFMQTTQMLINHCEQMRYRVAVLDSPNDRALSQVRDDRALLDTTRAAFYYPWVRVQDPITRQPIHVPPSGFVTGIYARNDIDRGVHKAPANEVVRGAIGLEVVLNKGQQDVLNPIGINCIRFFENRGIRVWGARTLSSDPEWKYLNIRRYFAFLEHSIERSTQWAVFEPNGEVLWANVRRAVEDFLYNEWKSEHLAGTKPTDAFFVRCDRTTMTQNDLDNGRMICLIGVSPLYPAEFVIFRIGQWTADRKA